MPDSVVEKVALLAAETLDMNPDEIGQDASMLNIPSWDSLAQINICMAIERHYGKMFDLDAIDTATSVKKLAEVVEKAAR